MGGSVTAKDSVGLIHPKYRPDIDGLRALAVIFVVAYHAFPSVVRGGFIGVDIFFVISGFLISTIIFESVKSGSFSILGFYARRVNRIFPALALVLFSSLVCGWFVLLPGEYSALGKHAAGGAGFISNILLWMESGYFDAASDTKPLLHLWSLGVEEQFYFVWPLLIVLAWKLRFSWLALIIITGGLSFWANIDGIDGNSVALFYSPYTRFWELIVGGVIAYFSISSKRVEMSSALLSEGLSVVGVLLLTAGLIKVSSNLRYPGVWALIPTIGAACIISAGPNAWINRILLSNKLLVGVGLISFPLYLWHWPILVFLRLQESEIPSTTLRCAAVGLSFALAWLTYRFIEGPVRSVSSVFKKSIALVSTMLIVGMLGLFLFISGGAPFRFPILIQELNSFTYDYNKVYRTGSCFLDPSQDEHQFSTCHDDIKADRKTLFLWGDSHAAHLFSGYEKNFGGQFNIIQRTASGCPPILGLDMDEKTYFLRPHCLSINNSILDEIKRVKPEKVVLSASWNYYDWARINVTIEALRAAGFTDLEIVGPVPKWKDPLPKELYKYFAKDPLHRVPERMTFGLDNHFAEIDKDMAAMANKLGVKYISPRSILCNPEGCLTRLGDTAETLTAWDDGHLTSIGSQYLISKFPRNGAP
ncbi:hypothetical protein ALP94_04610 [Pseudomonas savastanoi pv. glycinea]|nr:hypothetical protein ALP94_04610 [Pseudomonas savastanoi pv. glycinea]